ncbi:MAG: glycerol-3-phosphate 1-O-acyltransferase PlsY [Gammaproteobacteria bacterium]|nr:glycerol-3-phosphate 1-O-acyltransferase PlsY [Gammaproteobacteria bacterium]MDE2261946.1 glycerol-3-phosphate 1-O-acyltransferase PlsY [Gammaproteobacteria bacterium]
MTELLVRAVLGYLLGSIVGSLLIGRLRGGVDIRRVGSGNAGATNALRTQSKAFAFWVLLIDIGKGWMATGLLATARIPWIAGAPAHWRAWSVAVCGVAVVLGHVYPLWHGFRGGKGVATVVGAVLGASPVLLLPMLLIWLLAVILFGFVGLASILGAITFVVAAAAGSVEPRKPLLTFAVLSALLITFTHRGNIARMLAGTEPRARRLWLLGAARSRS